ncbi:hypothetical protein B0H17DRAFT_1142640 [Mycena rosella]|uniref:Uncharacterized protein n=1 Tax=Mycena rosella TaxID=1033263 RepID=A0AAD7CXC3_MYCRO|nr:hypothetical protein B0H17DRAFT_1142640 [Mycena rosella]
MVFGHQIFPSPTGIVAPLSGRVTRYVGLSDPQLEAALGLMLERCNVLVLLQCVTSHSDTRQLFLNEQEQAAMSAYMPVSATNGFSPSLQSVDEAAQFVSEMKFVPSLRSWDVPPAVLWQLEAAHQLDFDLGLIS